MRRAGAATAFLAWLAVALATAGCGPSAPEGRRVGFLAWRQHQAAPLDEALAAFEAETGIRVERRVGSENASQYFRELTTKLRNRDPDLDVFFLDVVWPTEMAERGWLLDLSSRLPAGDREAFFPAPIEACTVDGRLVAVPFNVDVGLLFYRRDLLEAHGFGPPATWDEMVAQVDAILAREGKAQPSLVGWVGQLDRYEGLVCNLLEQAASRGGRIVDPAGGPALAGPGSLAGVRFLRDVLIHDAAHPRRATDYVLTAREQESREVFARGDAIFLRGWPETWGLLTDSARSRVADRVAMAPLPGSAQGPSVGTLGGWQLGIASFSTRSDEAWELVRYLTRHDVQKRLAIGKSQPMARLSIYDDPELGRALPHFVREGGWGSPLRDACARAVRRPASSRYNAVSERIQRCVHEAIRDPASDLPALLAACDAEVNAAGAGTW